MARWGILIGLSLYLVFCHGCHGDEDNELFVTLKHRSPHAPHEVTRSVMSAVTGAALP